MLHLPTLVYPQYSRWRHILTSTVNAVHEESTPQDTTTRFNMREYYIYIGDIIQYNVV